MSQVYLIRRGSTSDNKENGYLEYVFKDYTEARKLALKLVKAYNKKNTRMGLNNQDNAVSNYMNEIIPDKWTSNNEIIEVAVFQLRNIKKQKKISICKNKDAALNISQEIILSH